jgi:baseplate J-like protein
MSTQYSCKKPQRRAVVLAGDSNGNPVLNGIDYLEVSPDQKTLSIHFLFPLPGQTGGIPASPALSAGNIIIEGGIRITGIRLQGPVASAGKVLTVKVNAAGDFSTYTLRLVTDATNPASPAGFDPQLALVNFSFKVACPSNFDCQQVNVCPPPVFPSAQIDYLAKDYASFRQVILDRLARIMPAWQETHSAELGIALVELLAYAGDQLSYYQDAVATEAYLGTARQRVSVRRHARLLDYSMHDGCNARAWVFFQLSSGAPAVAVPEHTQLITQTAASRGLLPQAQLQAAVNQGSQVFETLFAIAAHVELNELDFYTWSDEQCCLPQGATQATLVDNGAGALLKPGDLLLFEETLSPATGAAVDADVSHRQVVRLTQVTPGIDPLNKQKVIEIEWSASDALTFPLCLSTVITNQMGTISVVNVSVARGNIVLTDHGLQQPAFGQPAEELPPVGTGLYRPVLQNPDLTFAVAYDEVQMRKQPIQAAAGVLVQDPRQALPVITLAQNGSTWTPVRDLLNSPRTALNFVVETQNDGSAMLRFGDGTLGAPPVNGLKAAYRTGNGAIGNVGAGAIAHVIATPAVPLAGVADVRNPLPAQGGVDGETLDEVRSFAPWAFRTQERAVTEADYATVAQLQPQVKKAQATLRWTGSWYTMFITVERSGGQPVDAAFRAQVGNFLENFRLAGYDVEIEAPIFVPLDIAFTVCVAPGYFRSAVQSALLDAFSNRVLPNGQTGFFYPDKFTFGQPVFLSQIVATAMQVPGVSWVDTSDVSKVVNGVVVASPNRFQRWGQAAQGETAAGRIAMARLEIARLDNDPSQPENGRIQFFMEGGL